METSMIPNATLMLLSQPILLQGEAPTGGDAAKPAETPSGEAKAAKSGEPTKAVSSGGEPDSKTAPSGDAAADSGSNYILFVFVGIIILMFLFSGRSRKKQQKKFQSLYESLKRDDQIMLQNGKFVVVDVVEKDRITVFADKARNVREVYHRNAVANMASEVFGDAKTEGMKQEGQRD